MCEIFVPTKNRDRFLIGFQDISGWRDDCIFKRNLGIDEISDFRNTGIIPEKWVKHIKTLDGGNALLERHSENCGGEKVTEEFLVGEMTEMNRRKKVIKKKYAPLVLDNIKEKTGVGSDGGIAKFLGKHFTAVSAMRRRITYIHFSHIESVSQKTGVPIKDLLDVDIGFKPSKDKEKFVEKKSTCKSDDDENEFKTTIDKEIHNALLLAGGHKIDREEVFLGYLFKNISSVKELDGKTVIFENGESRYVFDFSHLSF